MVTSYKAQANPQTETQTTAACPEAVKANIAETKKGKHILLYSICIIKVSVIKTNYHLRSCLKMILRISYDLESVRLHHSPQFKDFLTVNQSRRFGKYCNNGFQSVD